MISSIGQLLLLAWLQGSKNKLRSLSFNLASQKTDASVAIITEVSTIPGGSALGAKGPIGIGLGGHVSITRGDTGRVGSLAVSTRRLALGDSGVSMIAGRAGQASKVPSLDATAYSTSDAVALVTLIIGA